MHTACCFFRSAYFLIGKANKAASPYDCHPPVLSGAPVFIPSLWKVLPHLEHIQSCEIERGCPSGLPILGQGGFGGDDLTKKIKRGAVYVVERCRTVYKEASDVGGARGPDIIGPGAAHTHSGSEVRRGQAPQAWR